MSGETKGERMSLTKEQRDKIRYALNTYPGVPFTETTVRALLDALEEMETLAYVGEHQFPDNTWKSRCEELRQQLATVEGERDEARYTLQVHADVLGETVHKHEQQLATSEKEHLDSIRDRDNARELVKDLNKKLAAAQETIARLKQDELGKCTNYLWADIEAIFPKLGVESAYVTDLSMVGDFPKNSGMDKNKHVWQVAIDTLRTTHQATVEVLQAILAECDNPETQSNIPPSLFAQAQRALGEGELLEEPNPHPEKFQANEDLQGSY